VPNGTWSSELIWLSLFSAVRNKVVSPIVPARLPSRHIWSRPLMSWGMSERSEAGAGHHELDLVGPASDVLADGVGRRRGGYTDGGGIQMRGRLRRRQAAMWAN